MGLGVDLALPQGEGGALGSATAATRPTGVSIGPAITVPPASPIAATASSHDATVKYTSQCAGSPSCGGRIPPLSAPLSLITP